MLEQQYNASLATVQQSLSAGMSLSVCLPIRSIFDYCLLRFFAETEAKQRMEQQMKQQQEAMAKSQAKLQDEKQALQSSLLAAQSQLTAMSAQLTRFQAQFACPLCHTRQRNACLVPYALL